MMTTRLLNPRAFLVGGSSSQHIINKMNPKYGWAAAAPARSLLLMAPGSSTSSVRLCHHQHRSLAAGAAGEQQLTLQRQHRKPLLSSAAATCYPYHHRAYCYSTTTTTTTTNSAAATTTACDLLGCGSFKSELLAEQQYRDTIFEALRRGIRVFEAGSTADEGQTALVDAYEQAITADPTLQQRPVQLLFRVGYRTVEIVDDGEQQQQSLPHDVHVEDYFVTSSAAMGRTASDHGDGDGDAQQNEPPSHDIDPITDSGKQQQQQQQDKKRRRQVVYHNIGPEAIEHAITTSPIVHLQSKYPDSIRATALLHNPEVAMNAVAGADTVPLSLQQRLQHAFEACETHCREGGSGNTTTKTTKTKTKIASYGIVSNGLSLPPDHPLHLSWTDCVLPAMLATAAAGAENSRAAPLHLDLIQLPANVLETHGIAVADQIYEDCIVAHPDTLGKTQVAMMRPLSCYPDRGTGTGLPFLLADYPLPRKAATAMLDGDDAHDDNDAQQQDGGEGEVASQKQQGSDSDIVWTNELSKKPEAYDLAMKLTMRHFDGEDIIAKKLAGEELSGEERETLDGCKLMQSLIHDVDASLDHVRSFAAHERELYEKIIPLIHDTFEEYDDTTADVLQTFFTAYNMAVRYAIAKNTRQLLTKGGDTTVPVADKDTNGETIGAGTVNAPTYPDLPQHVRLQEFAIHYLLDHEQRRRRKKKKEKNGTSDDGSDGSSPTPPFSRIMVGFSRPDHVDDVIDIVNRYLEGGDKNKAAAGQQEQDDAEKQ